MGPQDSLVFFLPLQPSDRSNLSSHFILFAVDHGLLSEILGRIWGKSLPSAEAPLSHLCPLCRSTYFSSSSFSPFALLPQHEIFPSSIISAVQRQSLFSSWLSFGWIFLTVPDKCIMLFQRNQ